MKISSDDMMELRRLASNTYEQEKSDQIYRIVRYIGHLESQVRTLTNENQKLKTQLNPPS